MPRDDRYIYFIDVETGGREPTVHPILTLGAAMLEVSTGEILETYEAKIKHENYDKVTPEALKVNKIDLEQHHNDPKAETPRQALQSFKDWLNALIPPRQRGIAGGHNLRFDRGFIECQFFFDGANFFDWEDYFHYRSVDTQVLATMMMHAGILALESTGLDAVLQIYNMRPTKRHDALGDAIDEAKVYHNMLSDLKNLRRFYLDHTAKTG
jgi:DNA polymerase-3 subunit epsilon/ribonuclease T